MSLIIPIIWVLLANLLLVSIFEKKFGTVTPISLILGTFFLFATGFVKNIILGYYLTWISFLAIPLIIYAKRRKISNIFKNYFSLGFFIFVIIAPIITIYHWFTAYSTWDEFQHWGPMISETMRLNQFYSVTESTLQTHKDYPPFVTLLQALWCFLSGGYAEAYCYRAMSIFSFSLFLPVIDQIKIKKKYFVIIPILSIVLITLINMTDYAWFYAFFETIYTDYFLGIFAAYTLFIVFKSFGSYDSFDYLNISFSLIALIMVKQMGIAFYAMALFVVFVQFIYNTIKSSFDKTKLIKIIVYFVIVPFLINRIWPIYIAQYNPDIQFSLSQISLSGFLDLIFNGNGEQWQIITLANFKDAIFNRNLFFGPFNITYFPFNFVITILLFLITRFILRVDKIQAYLISSSFLIGTIGYAFTMLLLYVFSFGPLEGPILASFERYINTYLYFGVTLLTLIILLCSSKLRFKYAASLLIISCLTCSMFVGSNWDILKLDTQYKGYASKIEYATLFDKIKTNLEDGDRLLLISQYQDQTVHILKYKFPNLKFDVISLGEQKYVDDPYSQNLTIEQWKDLLSNYNYLYTYSTDDVFYEDYWLPITEEDLINENLYSIDNSTIKKVN